MKSYMGIAFKKGMIKFRRRVLPFVWIYYLILIGLCLSGCFFNKQTASVNSSWQPSPEMVSRLQGFPQIGKWMFNEQYEPAYWLGELYHGKNLWEPINIVIIDTVSQSVEEAKQLLRENLKAAGYLVRIGHSTGYKGYIDGTIYEQIPSGKDEAFSNEPFETHNNHGRMFGPHQYNGAWLFIGAFSRESIDLIDKVKHRYVSFNQARDDLSQRLNIRTSYKIRDYLDLDNALIGNTEFTSGDHDGVAVFLINSGSF